MKILLIIPAYNEGKNILNVCNSIKKNGQYDYIVINDGSTDDTEKICQGNHLNYVSLINNLGIGGAVQTGYKYAYVNNYDIAIQFDGDGQHNVDYVEKIIEPLIKNEADMVIGSRYIDNLSKFKSSLTRHFGIIIISKCILMVTGVKILDTTSGFRAVNKKIIKLFSEQYPFEYPEPISTVKLIKKNYRIKELAVEMNERIEGVSSIKAWKTVYYMINVIFSIFAFGIGGRKK